MVAALLPLEHGFAFDAFECDGVDSRGMAGDDLLPWADPYIAQLFEAAAREHAETQLRSFGRRFSSVEGGDFAEGECRARWESVETKASRCRASAKRMAQRMPAMV